MSKDVDAKWAEEPKNDDTDTSTDTSTEQKSEEVNIEEKKSITPIKVDFSQDLKDKSDKEVLDYILDKDENELIPWEPVTLPSKGIYYEGKIPGGVVEVRPMSIYTEKILATLRLAKTGQAIDMMLQHCVRFPTEFDTINLLAGDSTFLLFYIRGITFGNMYEFSIKCSNDECRESILETFDLNELQHTIKTPKSDVDDEPFEVVLPYMSEITGRDFKVEVRMLRRYDLSTISNVSKPSGAKIAGKSGTKQVHSIQNFNDMIEKNLNLVIHSVMGEQNKFTIKRFVERMHSSDASTIREFLDEISPGMDTKIELKCPFCGNEMSVGLPITESFFRRTVGGGDRE